MASPGYDAKYRKHDGAPGRVIPCSLLSPDSAAATFGAHGSSGTLAVGDEQYEPWGTPHGGVIAELAERCMAAQTLITGGLAVEARPVGCHFAFRRRWTRGDALDWSTSVLGVDAAGEESDVRIVSIRTSFSMAGTVVTEARGTFLAVPHGVAWDGTPAERVDAHLAGLPAPRALTLPTHHAGWSAGRIEGSFEVPPASIHVALDEAMAAAANTVRGDAHGDELREDFLLADMSVMLVAASVGDDTLAAAAAGIEYRASIRRGHSGRDGFASAELVHRGHVLAEGSGRVAFLHTR